MVSKATQLRLQESTDFGSISQERLGGDMLVEVGHVRCCKSIFAEEERAGMKEYTP